MQTTTTKSEQMVVEQKKAPQKLCLINGTMLPRCKLRTMTYKVLPNLERRASAQFYSKLF